MLTVISLPNLHKPLYYYNAILSSVTEESRYTHIPALKACGKNLKFKNEKKKLDVVSIVIK